MKLIKNKVFLILVGLIFLGITLLIIYNYNYKYKVTQESIISDFNENYEYFSDVEKYINESKFNRIYAYTDSNSVDVKLSINDKNEINNNLPIKSQMENIFNKLNYESILAEKGYGIDNFIIFERKCKDGLEQGIVFLIDDDGKYGGTMVKIRDGWYYYTIGYV